VIGSAATAEASSHKVDRSVGRTAKGWQYPGEALQPAQIGLSDGALLGEAEAGGDFVSGTLFMIKP